jgi:hypothetical protein
MREALFRARQLVAIACLLVVVLAALSPTSNALLFAVLIPLWFFVAVIVSRPIRIADDFLGVRECPVCEMLSPRPPPAS